MEEKIILIKELKTKIENKYGKENVWFFPEYKGIKGFEGVQDIMFVGLNPSKGKTKKEKTRFPTTYDNFLYKNLKKVGFKNAHLTDLIKIIMTKREVNNFIKNKQEMEEQIKILEKEISIIKPKIIITMGRDCEGLLRKYVNKKVIYLIHYANRFNGKKELPKGMKKIKKEYILCKKKK